MNRLLRLTPTPPRKAGDLSFLESCPEEIASIFGYWRSRCGPGGMPRRRDIDPLDFPGHLPGIMLVDVNPAVTGSVGAYRYRLVGTAMVEIRGRDPTGLPVEEGFCGPDLEDVLDCYDSVRHSRTVLYDAATYWSTADRWVDHCTIFLPLSEDQESVSQIMVYSRRAPTAHET